MFTGSNFKCHHSVFRLWIQEYWSPFCLWWEKKLYKMCTNVCPPRASVDALDMCLHWICCVNASQKGRGGWLKQDIPGLRVSVTVQSLLIILSKVTSDFLIAQFNGHFSILRLLDVLVASDTVDHLPHLPWNSFWQKQMKICVIVVLSGGSDSSFPGPHPPFLTKQQNSLLGTVLPSPVFSAFSSLSWGNLFPSKTANVATLWMVPKREEALPLLSNHLSQLNRGVILVPQTQLVHDRIQHDHLTYPQAQLPDQLLLLHALLIFGLPASV